jgi:hypothetical protein
MSTNFARARGLRPVLLAAVLALALAACGDDDSVPDVPEGGTGNPYTQAIIEAESHDEIIFPAGGDMVVAVNCDAEIGETTGTLVTAVAQGLEPGTYTGVFDPSTGVDLVLEATGEGYAQVSAEMTLDADGEYTVTFADIEGGEFTVSGC